MNFKPMLAVDCGSLESLRFPLIASPKLDGVRAIIGPDCTVLSRSLKPIPNVRVRALLGGLPEGMDGELIAGEPTAPDAYRKTVSMVMSDEAPITGLRYYVFDIQEERPFEHRNTRVELLFPIGPHVVHVRQHTAFSLDELLYLEDKWTTEGYEGVILRAPGSPYKHGRSTLKEGYLMKLKRFQDGEAEVIGVTELMHNQNEAKTNELGRTDRGHKKAGMVPAGVLGTLIVRDVKTGVEFEIGTGFTAEERAELWRKWSVPDPYGELEAWDLVKYKHFPVGAKDKPRHPVFLGWRNHLDT